MRLSTNLHPQSSKDKSNATGWGCVGKGLSVLVVIILFGALGWFGTKSWINQVKPSKINTPDAVSSSDNQDWERANAIRSRGSQLGIDYSFFNTLVNQLFWQQYPQQEGKTPTELDKEAQNSWYELADSTLDKLSRLSEQVRQKLGKYTQEDNVGFIQQANQLHLSSKALYDLADGQFSQFFPEQRLPIPADNPLFQVEQGIISELLLEMQGGKGYEQILVTSDNSPSEFTNTLQSGQGQAYVAQLQGNQSITITLDADISILFSIYSPSGQVEMLQDSTQRQWAGILPEDGYYEITLVSKGQAPLNYNLKMAIAPSSP